MMSRHSGARISAIEHLRQSVLDILTTPIGSRVMRRDYGSLLPALIDQPDNLATQARVYSAIAGALMRWEPRLQLDKVSMHRDADTPGRVVVEVSGSYRLPHQRQPAPISLAVPLGTRALQGAA